MLDSFQQMASFITRHHVPQILVHESTSLWTAELERSLPEDVVTVRWLPHFPDFLTACQRELPEVAVMVVNATEATLMQISKLLLGSPQICLVLLADSDDPAWEWGARELGADVVLPDTTEKHRVVTSVKRLLLEAPAASCSPLDRK